jgi:iron only hydrogenase large subunit-like protein
MELSGKALFDAIKEEKSKGKFMVAQIAPAMRVTIGEEFGLPDGTELTGKLVSMLKALGFDEVIDTSFGADAIVFIEAKAFEEALNRNNPTEFPVFNSCCTGWREYAEKRHPELIPRISRIVTPMMMAGAVAKMFFSKTWNRNPQDITIVGIMPCTLKKHETQMEMQNGLRYTDYVVTTRELGEWARSEKLELSKMKDGFITDVSIPSKDGVIFGATGGITESLITTLAANLGEKKETLELRKNESLRECVFKVGKHEISTAVVFGFPALEKLLEKIKGGTKYHFVEVMMCTYGCVGGPGQPAPKNGTQTIMKRAEAMRKVADKMTEKTPASLKSIKSLDPLFFASLQGKGCFVFFENVKRE